MGFLDTVILGIMGKAAAEENKVEAEIERKQLEAGQFDQKFDERHRKFEEDWDRAQEKHAEFKRDFDRRWKAFPKLDNLFGDLFADSPFAEPEPVRTVFIEQVDEPEDFIDGEFEEE